MKIHGILMTMLVLVMLTVSRYSGRFTGIISMPQVHYTRTVLTWQMRETTRRRLMLPTRRLP